uniref:Uncharacterized protein n=1 Tax=Rhodosorus marinus TaxID=101924 RepID=A0A7S0G7R2_9RHOD|mmetsp:Transcript_9925/g.14380  ORF Transcript_9925/g.14380 Transcript_9925/m.14380 type:complete len:154 (+) Transcript_9925:158-619(+)|eukprot:CAMPEP_0184737610 /NCGR_PEP_ID=MMETSP0315-20130426/400_1 /TAXON_ID=101924 /ORGANISM="Rhodosorus marinus, Strain UTEX LB 2760" /LENGTH=153 /DNA_ID=CAMNT_0027204897 /DNA_START=122 /DNA_END=583 /DNA_ORIENTATION=+
MATAADSLVSMNGYFRVEDVTKSEAKTLIHKLLKEMKQNPGVKHRGFSVAYDDGVVAWNYRTQTAEDCIANLETISKLITKIFDVETYDRIEVSAPAEEIQKLKGYKSLSDMGAQYFIVEGKGTNPTGKRRQWLSRVENIADFADILAILAFV